MCRQAKLCVGKHVYNLYIYKPFSVRSTGVATFPPLVPNKTRQKHSGWQIPILIWWCLQTPVFLSFGRFGVVFWFAPRREWFWRLLKSFFGLCSRAYVRHKFYRFTNKINEIAINYPKPNHHFALSFFGGKSIS